MYGLLTLFRSTLPAPQDVSFPLFDAIKPEHVVPGVKQLLGELHAEIDKWVRVKGTCGLALFCGAGDGNSFWASCTQRSTSGCGLREECVSKSRRCWPRCTLVRL